MIRLWEAPKHPTLLHVNPETLDIVQADRLTAFFAHWPDFHDAELRGLRFEARAPEGPHLEADIEVAERSEEVDERGFYRDRQRCRTTLLFRNATVLVLEELREQNVLDEVVVRRLDPAEAERLAAPWAPRRLHVEFIPIPGFCTLRLLCDTVEVVHAESILAAT